MPEAPPDWNLYGWAASERLRVRTGWIRIRLERLWVNEDGRQEWRRERATFEFNLSALSRLRDHSKGAM